MGGWIRGFSLMRSDRDKPMGILGNDCVTILDISGREKNLLRVILTRDLNDASKSGILNI